MPIASQTPAPRWIAWLLLLAVTTFYLPSIFNGFIYDDEEIILLHDGPRTLQQAARVFAEQHFPNLPYYRPVTRLTLLLQKTIHGDDPTPFHAANAMLVGLAATLAFLLLRRPAFDLPVPLALAAAALFALHPVASSCVYPVSSGRETLLPAVLMLAATYAFLRRGAGWAVLSIVCFALALFAREQAIVLPLVFALAEITGLSAGIRGREPWRRLLRYGSMAFCIAVYLVARYPIFHGVLPAQLALLQDPAQPFLSYLFALQTAFVPFRELLYEPSVRVWLVPWRLMLAAVALCALALAAYRTRATTSRTMAFWLGWFVILQLPTANLLRQEALFDERYTFLAMLGLLGAAGAALKARGDRPIIRQAAVVAAGVLLVVASWISAGRQPCFANNDTFFAQWVKSDPNHARAHYYLATHWAATGRPTRAVPEFARAIELDPQMASAEYNLANTLLALGRVQESLRHYERARTLDPRDLRVRSNYGAALLRAGRPGDARGELEAVVRLEPGFADAHYNLGLVLAQTNEPAAAAAEFARTLDLAPQQVDAEYNLGLVLLRLDRPADAEQRFRAVLQFTPASADTHYNLGLALARQGSKAAAAAAFAAALRLNPHHADAHNNLGVLLTQAGQTREAWGHFLEAAQSPDNAQALANIAALADSPDLTSNDLEAAVAVLTRPKTTAATNAPSPIWERSEE